MFTVGQEVFSTNHGKGVVTCITEEALLYPVEVTFHDGSVEEFTQSGKEFISEERPSLVKFEESNMVEFYVGQEVCCKRNGKGVVVEIQEIGVYPVRVKFHNGGYDTYTADGKEYHRNLEPDLTPVQENPTFTLGQQVWCVVFGEGVVSRLTDSPLAVEVKFLNGEEEPYTSTGHLFSHAGNQTLFTYPVKVIRDDKATKPSIDWTHVNEKFKWLSVDANGCAYVYENEPKAGVDSYWLCQEGTLYEVNGLASYVPGTCSWEDSLVERPKTP